MSSTYLDRYRSTIPTSQGKQILKLLISKRDSGEIKNLDEFKKKLQELTTNLLQERIKPTFNLLKAIGGEDITSDTFNEMITRIEDDLETAFVESQNLSEIITAHHNVIKNITLKALRFGVNELESKVTLYEFLNKSGRGFDDAVFNTFREAVNSSLSRSDRAASIVFVDPRKVEAIPSTQDTIVDIIGERLSLGPDELYYRNIRKATWLSNSNSIRSEVDSEFANSSIDKIIDGQNGTYWVVPILLSKVKTDGVPLEIALTLSGPQDVNFLEIEPACLYPLLLESIDYFDSNNVRQTVDNTTYSINGTTRINFRRVVTHNLILRFRQNSFQEIQFRKRIGESNFYRAVLGEGYFPVDLESVSEDLKEVLTSDYILNDIIGVVSNDEPVRKYYEYTIGFDNIRIGFNTYDERSVFVSQKKTVSSPGQFGIQVSEVRPIQSSSSDTVSLSSYAYPARTDSEDLKFHHASIEYWLVIQSYTSDNYLISTDTIPMLPIGAERVYHEQLVLTKKSSSTVTENDMGSFMFYTLADSTDVIIYRNGVELTYLTDWNFVSSVTDNTITNETANNGSRMKRGIVLLESIDPLDIYTVSYTPIVSNTNVIPIDTVGSLFRIVDLTGDYGMRMVQDNIILLENTRLSYTVASADVYLVIIMRRNSAELIYAPAVEEYLLAIGSRNQDKFS